MKKRWVEPRVQVEEFMPNEYVAACWGVSCSVDAANTVEMNWMVRGDFGHWENNYENGQTHDAAHCGMQTNQWVIDNDGNGTVDRMIETGTDGLGDLTCTLYTGPDYKTTASFSGVTTGSYIYRTTTSGNRTRHHQRNVIGTDASHPNRS